jgi:raffinose/stachyose/melibiose transport system permease protein
MIGAWAREGDNQAASRHLAFLLFLTLSGVIWLTPVAIVVLTAIRSAADIAANGTFALPRSFEFSNFSEAWSLGVSQYLVNSLLITALKVPIGLLIASLAAFALSTMRFAGRETIFRLFILGLIIPVQLTLVPLNLAMTELDLVDSHAGLILLYVGFGLPFHILVLRGFMLTLPYELVEAAVIDGASWATVFWRVILPLARPALVALAILDGVATWNEFILAQIFLRSSEKRTLALGVVQFTTEISTAYDLLAAAQCITIIPVLVLYLMFQRYFVQGVAGAVK